MKKHILCLGDSNTHGYCADPGDCDDSTLARFNEEERWTCLLQRALGDAYLVIEEGLSGRTTVFEDPLNEGMPALPYLAPCLKSHEPVSLLIIMLGTNDTKEYLGVSAFAIGQGMRRLVRKAKATDCWGPEGTPNILVVAPPPMGDGVERSYAGAEMGRGAVEKSRQLAALYKTVAAEEGVHFLDAGAAGCVFNTVDHMHLTQAGHAALANALSPLVLELT